MAHSFKLSQANAAYIDAKRAYGAKSRAVNTALDRQREIVDGGAPKTVTDLTTVQLIHIACGRLFKPDTTAEDMNRIIAARDEMVEVITDLEVID